MPTRIAIHRAAGLRALLASLAVIASACGGGGGGGGGTAATLSTIEVTPPTPSVPSGRTQQFTATGHYSDGSQQDVSSSVTWSATGAATVSATGLATSTAEGSATITATSGAVSGSAMLTVTAAVLDRIDVTPANASIPNGRTQQFTATGHYSAGLPQDLTSTVTWTSDPAVATMSAGGLATGRGEGSTLVTATLGSISGNTPLTVTAAVLDRIELSPASTSVAKGATVAFTATGRFSDGTGQPYGALVTWGTGNALVATVSAGVAFGVEVGVTQVTATYGALSASARLEVTSAALASISVSPGTASIAKGRTQQFTATANFVGGGSQDITTVAVWSADPLVATVDAAGLVTGAGVGSTAVTATWGGVAGSASLDVTAALLVAVTVSPPSSSVALGYQQRFTAFAVYSDGGKVDVSALASWAVTPGTVASIDGSGLATSLAEGDASVTATYDAVTGSAALTVTSAVLQSLALSPTDPVLPLGLTQQFTAVGVFSNGSRLDLTSQVTWSSSDTGVVTLSTAGLATPVAASPNPITVTATHGTVTGQTSLTVTSATLDAIAVTPAMATIAAGTTQPFTATGIYSDASTQDLTAVVIWESSDPAVTVSNAAGSHGVATGVTAGSAQVTATLGALSDVAILTVTAATLDSITLAPADAIIPVGVTQQLLATGHFSDGSTQDLTASCAWVSSDPAVASISNAPGQEGLASGLAEGAVTVEATFASVTGSTTLTVSGATLDSIIVTPAAASLPKGYKLQFTATAHYSDGTLLDVTPDVTWSSTPTTIATISNALGTQGLATGVAAGTATVRATLGTVSGTTTLTVVSTTLKSIAVTPNPFTVAVRGTIQLTARGTFQNGMTLDVTTQIAWSSSNRKVATVSKTGLVTGVKAGSVTIKAAKSGKSGTASGTVGP